MERLTNNRLSPKMKRIEYNNQIFIIQEDKLLIEKKRLVQVGEDWKVESFWELLCADINDTEVEEHEND